MNTGIVNVWNRQFIKRFLLLLFSLMLFQGLVIGLLYRSQIHNIDTVVESNSQQWVKIAEHAVNAELGQLHSDVLYLAEHVSLQQWLTTGDAEAQQQFIRDLLTFISRRNLYDQLRFIDLQGQEQVRVSWRGNQAQGTPVADLQNKANRYYVRNALALKRDQIYVSPFDLNIEFGKIEQPIKPVIRLATPVFDDQGRKRGLIVANYLGQRLLDELKSIPDITNHYMWLINRNGNWILGPEQALEWGFMYPQREPARFEHRFPAAWSFMQEAPVYGQFTTDAGLFTYARVIPLMDRDGASEVEWTLINHHPATMLAQRISQVKHQLVIVFSILSILLAVLSGVITWASQRRQQNEARIRASEARFRDLFDSAPNPIIIVDQTGCIRLVNAQAGKVFGYASVELIGQPIDILVPERFRPTHVVDRSRYIDNPATRPMGAGGELYGLCKNGSELPVEISLSPLETDQGLLITSIILDITERKQSERRIQQLNEHLQSRATELESINHELEAFSYSVSHDLRAPLRAMDGFSRTLLNEYANRLDDKGRDRLQRIRAAAQRMAGLIDDMLSLSRISRMDVKREKVDLSEIARDVMASLRQQEPERSVRFSAPEVLIAEGDVRLLQVVMSNLLGNAWKFTGQCVDAIVELGILDSSESVYYVRDNGAGFDMAYANKLFGAFQRLHDSHEFPGTGIGLATVQRVIHKHGGRIWAESTPGQGAVFYFTLTR